MKTVTGHGLMKNLELELSERFWHAVCEDAADRNKLWSNPSWNPRSSLDHDPAGPAPQVTSGERWIMDEIRDEKRVMREIDEARFLKHGLRAPPVASAPCWRCYLYGREPAPKDAPAHTCVTVTR